MKLSTCFSCFFRRSPNNASELGDREVWITTSKALFGCTVSATLFAVVAAYKVNPYAGGIVFISVEMLSLLALGGYKCLNPRIPAASSSSSSSVASSSLSSSV